MSRRSKGYALAAFPDTGRRSAYHSPSVRRSTPAGGLLLLRPLVWILTAVDTTRRSTIVLDAAENRLPAIS